MKDTIFKQMEKILHYSERACQDLEQGQEKGLEDHEMEKIAKFHRQLMAEFDSLWAQHNPKGTS